MHRFIVPAAAAALLSLTACDRLSAEASTFKPTASFQDIMLAVIDPAAEHFWDAVSTEIGKAGVVEKQPHTDEEWAALRAQAVVLVEAANLLAVEGRPIAAHGKTLDNRAGYLNPEDIHRVIQDNRPAYLERVEEFRQAGARAVAAADDRKPADVVDAGARIQQACEHCHLAYWYPNGGPPNEAALKAGRDTTRLR